MNKKLLSIISMIVVLSAISCANNNTNPTEPIGEKYAGTWGWALEYRDQDGSYAQTGVTDLCIINADGSVNIMEKNFAASSVQSEGNGKYKIALSDTELAEFKAVLMANANDPTMDAYIDLISSISFRLEFANETSGNAYMDATVSGNNFPFIQGKLTKQQ